MLCYSFSTKCSSPNHAIPAFQAYVEKTLKDKSFDFAFIFNTHQVSDGESIYKYLKYHFGTEKPYVFFQIPYFATQQNFREEGFGAIFFKFENPKSKVDLEVFSLRDIQSVFDYAEKIKQSNRKLFHIVILSNVEKLIRKLIPAFRERKHNLKYPLFGFVSGTHDWDDGSYIITNKGVLKEDELILIRFENFNVYTNYFLNLRILTTNFNFKTNDIVKINEIEGENPYQLLTSQMETIRKNRSNIVHYPILITSHEPKGAFLRYPKRLEEDGLIMWGDIPEEGTFVFVNQYDTVSLLENFLKNELNNLLPNWDFILVANCVGKNLFFNIKKEYEVFRSCTRKPYIVLGTLGEITSVNKKPFLLNGALNILAMKEIVEE
jgi:hypothetical protein